MTKVPVSTRALSQRINRALAKDGKKLVKARSAEIEETLGSWYIVNGQGVDDCQIDLEEYARELGVLKGWECVEGDT
jgi:hypothetical protein